MIVNIEEIHELTRRLREINAIPLEDIEFHENGNKIEIDKKTIEEYQYVGLNNAMFITSGYYMADN